MANDIFNEDQKKKAARADLGSPQPVAHYRGEAMTVDQANDRLRQDLGAAGKSFAGAVSDSFGRVANSFPPIAAARAAYAIRSDPSPVGKTILGQAEAPKPLVPQNLIPPRPATPSLQLPRNNKTTALSQPTNLQTFTMHGDQPGAEPMPAPPTQTLSSARVSNGTTTHEMARNGLATIGTGVTGEPITAPAPATAPPASPFAIDPSKVVAIIRGGTPAVPGSDYSYTYNAGGKNGGGFSTSARIDAVAARPASTTYVGKGGGQGEFATAEEAAAGIPITVRESLAAIGKAGADTAKMAEETRLMPAELKVRQTLANAQQTSAGASVISAKAAEARETREGANPNKGRYTATTIEDDLGGKKLAVVDTTTGQLAPDLSRIAQDASAAIESGRVSKEAILRNLQQMLAGNKEHLAYLTEWLNSSYPGQAVGMMKSH